MAGRFRLTSESFVGIGRNRFDPLGESICPDWTSGQQLFVGFVQDFE
jgi:hypothetical protein